MDDNDVPILDRLRRIADIRKKQFERFKESQDDNLPLVKIEEAEIAWLEAEVELARERKER
jgi:hypothetical protein